MRNKRIIATLAAVAAAALVPAAGAQAASKSPSATVSTVNAGQPRDLAGAPATESPGAQQSAMGGGSLLLTLMACLGMDYTLHDGNAPSDTEESDTEETDESGTEDTGTGDTGTED